MKPRFQLRFLSVALFALGGRAGAESLPPFEVPAALLGKPEAIRSRKAAPVPEPAVAAPQVIAAPSAARAATMPVEPVAATARVATPSARSEAPGAASAAAAVVTAPVPAAGPSAPPQPVAAAVATRSGPAPAPVKNGESVITADKVFGRQDFDVTAEGRAVLLRDGTRVEGDRLQYFELTDEVEATGNVRMTRGDDVMTGPHARFKVQEQVGTFDTPSYEIFRPPRPPRPGQQFDTTQQGRRQPISGHGSAESLELEGENQFRFLDGTWSSCKPDRPDWYLRARELQLDFDREVGEANNGTLYFKDVPVVYLPWADFPLGDQRQSGLLAPSFGTSNKVGFDLAVPYYWNIAPNYDSTITPRLMGRRGLQIRDEVRYMTPTAKGMSFVEWMPNDQVENRSRLAGQIRHNETTPTGWVTAVDVSGVSDPRYFIDLSSRLSLTSQVNLLRQGSVGYYGGGWWNATGMLQAWQTLQDPNGAAVSVPYKRLPQLTLTANRPELPGGTAFLFNSEFVAFSHPTQDEGRRLTLYPQLSLPLVTSAFYVTPKVGVHATEYSLDRRTSTGPDSIQRSLPILSVDSGVNFERDTQIAGREFTQTLEPRIYYLYVPYRDQSNIPNFDSGVYDFNFAQIFAENYYTGGDRISNANQITTAVQSRLINPNTGAEVIRAAFGQRYYLEEQRVTLPGVAARTGGQADFLAAFGGQIAPRTQLDTGWQYNPRDHWTERFNAGVRYQPGFARALNASWRYRRNYSTVAATPDGFRDLDLTGQWPLAGNWYAVGRYNRNLRDHRLTEGIAGFEYNGGCWVARTVVQHLTTSATDTTRAFFVQIEFSGLASLGSNPINMLRRSVPGYGKISDPGSSPFFTNDDY